MNPNFIFSIIGLLLVFAYVYIKGPASPEAYLVYGIMLLIYGILQKMVEFKARIKRLEKAVVLK